MIRYDVGDQRFNYRVVGVALHEGQVLLHRGERDGFWSLPGGRAELAETAEDTLKREMREELDVEVDVVRLLWVVENFFHYDGKQYHELAMYFLMQGPRWFEGPRAGREAEAGLTFRWFPNDEATLAALPVLPAFLQERMPCPPATIEHVIYRSKSTEA